MNKENRNLFKIETFHADVQLCQFTGFQVVQECSFEKFSKPKLRNKLLESGELDIYLSQSDFRKAA